MRSLSARNNAPTGSWKRGGVRGTLRAMIIEYIRYTIEDRDAFVRAYAAASVHLDTSTHCLAYELAECVEEPSQFILRIEWDSAEGHRSGFRRSPEFSSFLALVRPYIDSIREMRHYELTTVRSRKT